MFSWSTRCLWHLALKDTVFEPNFASLNPLYLSGSHAYPFGASFQHVLWLLGIFKLKGIVVSRTWVTQHPCMAATSGWMLWKLWRISVDLASQWPHLPLLRGLGMATRDPSWSQKQTWNLTLIICGLQNWTPANSGDWRLKGTAWLDFLLGQGWETFCK